MTAPLIEHTPINGRVHARVNLHRKGGPMSAQHKDLIDKVEKLLLRRPEKAESIAKSLGANPQEVIKAISFLVSEGRAKKRQMGNEVYYEIKDLPQRHKEH